MRWVILGAGGQLGGELALQLRARTGDTVHALGHADCDVTQEAEVHEVLAALEPEVVVNCAARVRVDDCERERDATFAVHATGARHVAEVCAALGALDVYVSTDYVFGGEAARKQPYDEEDTPAPLNVYGASKLEGERVVLAGGPNALVVRTSGLFGGHGTRAKGNFVLTVLGRAERGEPLRIVDDQLFSPSYAPDVARRIVELVERGARGIAHATNRGACSWYDLACRALELAGHEAAVLAITTDSLQLAAPRPHYSVLADTVGPRLGVTGMPAWEEALARYILLSAS